MNYGDGTGTSPLTLNPITLQPAGDQYTPTATGTFDLSHVFTTAGTYTVNVTVTNDAGNSGIGVVTVNVLSAPPQIDNTDLELSPTVIDENGTVTLTVKFSDATPVDSHTVQVIWGDDTTSFATVDQVNKTFSAIHKSSTTTPRTPPATSTRCRSSSQISPPRPPGRGRGSSRSR